MGQATARKQRFLKDHPVCFFCASRNSVEIDHVPSRECFRDGIGPEGYEFPACYQCNHDPSQIEQAVAFYIGLGDFRNEYYSKKQMRKLARGTANNTPHLAPKIFLSANEKRRAAREAGITLQPGQSYADLPLALMPIGIEDAFRLFARRLTCALYYREVGHPLPPNFLIRTDMRRRTDPGFEMGVMSEIASLMPTLVRATRRNTSIGDQFLYRFGYSEADHLFGYVAQIRDGCLIFGSAVAPGHPDITDEEDWDPHHGDFRLPGPTAP